MNNNVLDKLVEKSIELWPKNFTEYEKEFNKCCFSISYNILKSLGLFLKKGDGETIESIESKIELNPDARYLLKNILFILQEEGTIKKIENKYICTEIPDIQGPAELLVELSRKYPNEQASFQWVARAYDGMLDFIKGNVYPEDIMFPWSSFELVENVYNTSEIYGFYSKLTGFVIKELIEKKFNNQKVTILEIGAGTGNGTLNVIKESKSFSKYIFTDISKSLLRSSKKIFTDDFFEFKQLDITKDPIEQGIESNSIDIVFAVNVFHATSNAYESLKNAYKILKKNGALILSEISPPKESLYRYMELTFGLLPSYSNYQDKDARPFTPIIRPEEWIRILKLANYKDIDTLPYGKIEIDDRGGIILGFKGE